jgi:alpha-beta hydrolase superfamily lysophospholipase
MSYSLYLVADSNLCDNYHMANSYYIVNAVCYNPIMETQCRVVEIITPKKIVLNGLWFGPEKPERVVIFIHGLASSAFSNHRLTVPLVDPRTAVLLFNNRGHDKVTRVKKIDKRKKRGYISITAGAAHEVFTDCVDDIQGAVDFAKSRGVRNVYLFGHSTGCQKSVYYLSKSGKQQQVAGVILLAPMSDYAGALKFDKEGQLAKATALAKKHIAEGKEHFILPLDVWPGLDDAQRFLSLYTPDSKEEIFSYCQPKKHPRAYASVKIPMLIVLGGKDEYRDRPIQRIGQWFIKYAKTKDHAVNIINNSLHSFFEHEGEVTSLIRNWLK